MSDMDNPENESKITGSETPSNGEAFARKYADTTPPAQPDLDILSLMESLKAENAELKDRMLRTMAEMENVRRRTERDKNEMAKYAVSDFARDVLVIGDNLRRTIEAVPKKSVAGDPVLTTLLEGVEVTERELFNVLERQGIKRFDPKGEKFDPHVHNAMMRIETSDTAPDTVFQVIHAGYMIGERVLRPADVIVAKAGKGPAVEKIPPSSKHEHSEVPSDDRGMRDKASDTVLPPEPDGENTASAEEIGNVIKMMSGTRKGFGGDEMPSAKAARRVNVTTSVLPQQTPQQQKRTSSMTKPVIDHKDDAPPAGGGRADND
jgi:molecular chaperone GrpE